MIRSSLLAGFRVVGLLALVAYIFVVQRPAMALGLDLADVFPHWWLGWICRVMGIEVTVRGELATGGPVVYVANHQSYLDISVIGSVINAIFISRADVRDWPVFGYVSTFQRTIFIEREPRHAKAQRDELVARLQAGDSLILFPEGTSSDGIHMLPFKTSLFSIAEIEVDGKPVSVQPLSVAYTHLDGMPLGRSLRPYYAWYGSMEFIPHLMMQLGIGRLGIEIVLHPPVDMSQFASRKEMSEYCERVIKHGFSEALAGRFPDPAPGDTRNDAAVSAHT